MLQIQGINKKYTTGDLVQTALNDVNLNLRDNEFVAILGPSGSGKTTLLNIIGGLDRYDSGDLIINGISTKKYNDRDWDSYRNHTIGFVFQSYNLIPHQTILSNVELALTISGISKSERRNRAKEALEKVGLGEQLHKKPNQMSGGQMQRVAIARALVNNPDILLADEPTGALDTDTSIQVMELLKEVAKDRLVVMVTHNPELAEQYANRIVRLRDGKILDDSNPFEVDTKVLEPPKHKNMGKSSMSVFTALSLSFNNLRTKKARTLLTAFAGSIGIIGIALILSISTGVNNYINDIQKDTMTSYPISIQDEAMDLSAFISTGQEAHSAGEAHKLDAVYSNGMQFEMASSLTTSITENNLTKFKKYLDDPDSEIHKYIGENGIIYSYDTQFGVYTHDKDGTFVNTDGSSLSELRQNGSSMMGSMSSLIGTRSNENFSEITSGQNGELINPNLKKNYDLIYGSWPEKYNEIVLVLNSNNEIDTETLYELGLLPTKEYRELTNKILAGEEVEIPNASYSYEEISNMELYLVPACDRYTKNSNGTYTYAGDNYITMENIMKNAVKLKVSGIIRPAKDAEGLYINSVFGYTKLLTDYIIDYTGDSEIVKAQLANPNVNVINGMRFGASDNATKIEDAKKFLANMGISEKASMCKDMLTMMTMGDTEAAAKYAELGEAELAAMFDSFMQQPEDSTLLSIYDNYISSGTYEDNLSSFGVISYDAPSGINIYADTFEDKDKISECIKEYNKTVNEEDQIMYTDYVALLMSSVTTIIDVISYVLIAFVSVSLVVSSIMIGIITYISVLERTKEIGILRAIGASKRNIAQVFNAETFIVGLCSGLMGIGITLLILLPANALIHSLAGTTDINAALPPVGALILIILSVILTLIGGLIPSKKAARKDPVTALRTE